MWLAADSTRQLMSGSRVTTLHLLCSGQARPSRSEPGTQLQSWSWPLEPVREKSSRSECVVWSDDVSVATDQVAVTESEGCGQWQPEEWSREGARTGTHHTQDNTFPDLIRSKPFMISWISLLAPSVKCEEDKIVEKLLCVIWCYVRESDLYCCETMWNIPIIKILQCDFLTWTLFYIPSILFTILLSELCRICWFSFIYFALEIQYA